MYKKWYNCEGRNGHEKRILPTWENPLKPLIFLLLEVPFQQALEGFAVTSLVPCHFMDCVMNSVQAEFLGFLGQVGLALGGAVLGFHADLQVFLGAGGDDFAQEFRKPGGVIGFLKRGGLPVFRDLRITFTGGGAGEKIARMSHTFGNTINYITKRQE